MFATVHSDPGTTTSHMPAAHDGPGQAVGDASPSAQVVCSDDAQLAAHSDSMQLVQVQLGAAPARTPTSAGSLARAPSKARQGRAHSLARLRTHSRGSHAASTPPARKQPSRRSSTAGTFPNGSKAAGSLSEGSQSGNTVHSARAPTPPHIVSCDQSARAALSRTMSAVQSMSVAASTKRAAAAVSSIDAMLRQTGKFA